MIFNNYFARSPHSDLLMVVGAVGVVALMIVPVSPLMLDALIGFNIIVAVILVLVSIYISAPTDFTVFPSLLLVTTLYRLSLSIATTRMILTTAHAGRIIDVFGNMTAGGNIVVGLVVFSIITVVQFVVVAKGADRVAEVAARFSLDAMPGKQLAIDSDLRSGLTDKDDARRRRRLVELEGKLHGSLDGAMKFIKGDAMAGIVIVLINLIGGLSVGMLQQGMSFDDAIRTYSVLTIGDGMVSQIPALLAALAAGLMVTRVSGEGQEGHLGEAVQQQLMQKPRVLLVAGCLCLVLALVPGFPAGVFIVFGALGVTAGIVLDRGIMQALAQKFPLARRIQERTEPTLSSGAPAVATPVCALALVVDGLGAHDETWSVLGRAMADVVRQFESEIGVTLPGIVLQPGSADGAPQWRLTAFELGIADGACEAERLVEDIRTGVREALRRNLRMFMGVQEASVLVQRLNATHPEVTREALRVLPIVRIAEVLRLLVEEEAPLRNLHLILERLADAGQSEKDGQVLANLARLSVSAHIVARYVRQGELRAVVVTGQLEKQLRKALQPHLGQQVLALDPQNAGQLLQSLHRLLRDHQADVIVAAMDIRRPLRRLIATDLFDTPVLAHNELRPPTKLRVLAQAPPLALHEVEAAA